MSLVHTLCFIHTLECGSNHCEERTDHTDVGNGTRERKNLCTVVLVLCHKRCNAPERNIADGVSHTPENVRNSSPRDYACSFAAGLLFKTAVILEFLNNCFGNRCVCNFIFAVFNLVNHNGILYGLTNLIFSYRTCVNVCLSICNYLAVCILGKLPCARNGSNNELSVVKRRIAVFGCKGICIFNVISRIYQLDFMFVNRLRIHSVNERKNCSNKDNCRNKQEVGLTFTPLGSRLIND